MAILSVSVLFIVGLKFLEKVSFYLLLLILEYCFGFTEDDDNGVYSIQPRSNQDFVYRCSVDMGELNIDVHQFEHILKKIRSDYAGSSYHIINKNCNHFSEDLCQRVLQKSIPSWVNRLSWLASVFPCLVPDSILSPPGSSKEDVSLI